MCRRLPVAHPHIGMVLRRPPVGVTLGDLLNVVVRAGTDHAFTKEVHEFYLHASSEFVGNVTTMK